MESHNIQEMRTRAKGALIDALSRLKILSDQTGHEFTFDFNGATATYLEVTKEDVDKAVEARLNPPSKPIDY